jgi:hypothetical protein
MRDFAVRFTVAFFNLIRCRFRESLQALLTSVAKTLHGIMHAVDDGTT